MTDIYMVTGTSGAYEDQQTWNVAAFTDEQEAILWRRKAQHVANEIYNIARVLYTAQTMKEYYEFCSYRNLKDKNPYDPNMHFDTTTNVEYEVDTVTLNPTIT